MPNNENLQGGVLSAPGGLHQVLPLRRPVEDAAILPDILLQGWIIKAHELSRQK